MTTRAALYARISEDEPGYDKPAVQLKNLKALAASHGYVVVDEFTDRVSAFANADGELKERADFALLLQGIAAGRYDVVMAVARDRISRDSTVNAQFRQLCRRSGVKIHLKTGGLLNLDDPTERVKEGILDLFSELDVAMRVAKQRDRFDDETANGRPLWGVRPFGYAADPDTPPNRNGQVTQRWTVLHEDEAAEIRWAYSHILSGGTVYSILSRWNRADPPVLTTRGKPWTYAGVRQLLLRPRNAGIVVHRGKVLEGVEAAWEPLVEREEYESVVALLTDPERTTAPGRKPTYLLSSIARCGVCGGPMRSARANKRGYYRCATRLNVQAQRNERHAAIDAAHLDARVRTALASYLLTAHRELDETPPADFAHLDVELAKIRKGRAGIVSLIARGLLTEGQAGKELQALKTQEQELETQRDVLSRTATKSSALADLRATVFQGGRASFEAASVAHGEIVARLLELPLDHQRALVRSSLSVTVNPGRSASRVSIENAD